MLYFRKIPTHVLRSVRVERVLNFLQLIPKITQVNHGVLVLFFSQGSLFEVSLKIISELIICYGRDSVIVFCMKVEIMRVDKNLPLPEYKTGGRWPLISLHGKQLLLKVTRWAEFLAT